MMQVSETKTSVRISKKTASVLHERAAERQLNVDGLLRDLLGIVPEEPRSEISAEEWERLIVEAIASASAKNRPPRRWIPKGHFDWESGCYLPKPLSADEPVATVLPD